MKIALINASELEMAPFVRTYMDSLETLNVDYDLIEWRRDIEKKTREEHIVSFNYPASIKRKRIQKLFDYWKFCRFVRTHIEQEEYDFLVIFGYQTALFLRRFLVKYYSNRYILDIRDYSTIYQLIGRMVRVVDKNAYVRVLSSPGYSQWLTPNNRNVICHNTTHERLSLFKDLYDSPFDKPITILTNGFLRSFSLDKLIVESFKDKNVQFIFAGKGPESSLYLDLSNNNPNVDYIGFYKREDEIPLVQKCSFINIFLQNNMCYNTAMSNRFYLSLIVGVPMIVNAQNIQAKYVKEYDLGIVADKPEEIPARLFDYIESFDLKAYNDGRRRMLETIKNDMLAFQELLKEISEYN